jgi:flagella basal body P-ring formation protein FlgA
MKKTFLVLMLLFGQTGFAHALEILELPVPIRNVAASETLAPSDFAYKKFEVTAEQKVLFLTSTNQLSEKESVRALRAGRPVSLKLLRPRILVRKGDSVVASYGADNIEIRSILIAEQDGSAGDVIEARNGPTGKVLRGVVTRTGTLRIEVE